MDSRQARYYRLSDAKYWLNCPGQPSMRARHPELGARPKGGEIPQGRKSGLACHHLVTSHVQAHCRPSPDLVGKVYEFEEGRTPLRHLLSPKDVAQAQEVWDAVDATDAPIRLTELKVAVARIVGEEATTVGWYGYVDVVLRAPDSIHIIELKFGATPVILDNADDGDRFPLDEQTFLELAAVVENHPGPVPQNLTISIYQPNAQDHPAWQTKTLTRAEYVELLQAARNRYQSTQSQAAKPRAGSWCTYCPAQPVCLVHASTAFKGVGAHPDMPEQLEKALLTDVEAIPLQRVLEVYRRIPLIRSYVRELEKFVLQHAQKGGSVPNTKLVQKRTHKKWLDEAATRAWAREADLLPDQFAPRALHSPAQLTALAKARNLPAPKMMQLEELVAHGQGSLALVPAISPTPEYAPPSLEGVFPDVTSKRGSN